MSDQIVVTVVSYGRKFLYMRYTDPLTGKAVTKSTGTADKKQAAKVAAKWEAELQTGRYKPPSKVSWIEFRQRYEDERLPALARRTADKVSDVFNAVEVLLGIDKLIKLNATQISRFQQLLREQRKLSEATIKSHLAHIAAALRWAKRVGLLNEVPSIEMPKRGKGNKVMKGRPISGEEFDRMLAKVADIVTPTKPEGAPVKKHARTRPPTPDELDKAADLVRRWQWFLCGLWFSGLRLGEALDLSWDESGHITVDLSDRFPMFVIPADRQKSGEDQVLPVSPEFAEMLLSVPQDQRTGTVFKLGKRFPERNPALLAVSKIVSEIGKAAKVIVNRTPEKFASAHDFRRSFGERWSTRVMPAVLQQMMRHADISTTMKFYVGQNGQRAAAEIYAAYALKNPAPVHTSGNTSQTDGISNDSQTPQVPSQQ